MPRNIPPASTAASTSGDNPGELPCRVLLDALSEGALLLRGDGTVAYVNPRLARWLAQSPETLVGAHWSSFFAPPDHARLSELLEAVASREARAECSLTPDADTRLPVQVSLSAVRVRNGGDSLFAAIVTVLPGCDHTAESARQSEGRFRAMFETHHSIMLLIEPVTGRIEDANPAAARFYGYSRERLRAMRIEEINQLSPKHVAFQRRKAAAGQQDCFVFPHRLADGTTRWVEVRSSPIEQQGRPLLFSIIHDITERTQAVAALQASEQRFRQMAAAISEVFWMMTPTGDQIPYVSPAVERIWGLSAEAIMTNPGLWLDAILPEDRPCIEGGFQRLLQGEDFTAKYRVIRPDKTTCWVSDHGYPILDAQGRVTMLVGVASDITTQQRMEDELQAAQEERFRAIFNGASDGILLADMTTRKHVLANASICRMLGYTAEELTALRVEDIHPAAELHWILKEFEKVVRGEINHVPELPVQRKDGSVLFVSVGSASVTLGDRLFVAGFFRDITERKQVEEALKDSEARYRSLVDHLPLAVVLTDAAGRAIAANPAAARLQGFDRPDELLGQSLADYLVPGERARVMQIFASTIERGFVEPFESLTQRRDGSSVPAELSGVVIRNAQGQPTGLLAIAKDITERKRAQAEASAREGIWQLFLEKESMEVTYQRLAEGLTKYLGFPFAAVKLYDATRQEMVVVGSSGMPGIQVGLRVPARQTHSGVVIRTQSALCDNHADEHMQGLHPSLHRLGVRTCICAPFALSREVSGTLVVADREVREDAAAWLRNLELIGRTLSLEINRRQALEALQASEIRFRHYVETASEALLVCDASGRILDVNQKACLNSGYHRAELLERNLLDLVTDSSRESIARILAEFEVGISGTLLAEGRRKDGRTYPLETSYVAFELEGECRYLTLSRDITERVRLEEELRAFNRNLEQRVVERTSELVAEVAQRRESELQLRKLWRAVEHSPATVVITDNTGVIEYVNPQFERDLGYPAAEVQGRNLRLLQSDAHSSEFYASLWRALGSGQTWRGELCNCRKDGSQVWESAAIAPVLNGEGQTTHFVAIMEDISELRQTAEELRQAKENAESANRAKSVFLTNMSHEIRTPLNAVLGFAQLMLRDARLTAEQRNHLKGILRGSEHLLHVINQILDMARIESGRSALITTTFDLAALLHEVEGMFRPRTTAQQLVFECKSADDLPHWLEGDSTKLRQILINLLGNAFKFTPAGGRVMLRAEGAPAELGRLRLRLEVEDSGPGIKPEEVERLFEPFSQTEAGHAAGGTGLGLSISRRFARLMGGDLTVRSNVGQGSCFEFQAPFQLAVGQSGPNRSPALEVAGLTSAGVGYRVLVVDDEPNNRYVLSELLSRLGFSIRSVGSGAEALEQCAAWSPGLVLLDLRMPEMDGFEVARRLRAAHASGLKILVLTADVSEGVRERATAAGADALMLKPFRDAELLERIGELTGVEYERRGLDGSTGAETSQGHGLEPAAETAGQLPPALVAALRTALVTAEHAALLELTTQVTRLDEPLGRLITEMLQRYDYAAVEALLVVPGSDSALPGEFGTAGAGR